MKKDKFKIIVKSDFMEDVFFVSTDAKALYLLKKINKLHLNIALKNAGKKPYRSHYSKYWDGKRQYLKAIEDYYKSISFKIKVEIKHL